MDQWSWFGVPLRTVWASPELQQTHVSIPGTPQHVLRILFKAPVPFWTFQAYIVNMGVTRYAFVCRTNGDGVITALAGNYSDIIGLGNGPAKFIQMYGCLLNSSHIHTFELLGGVWIYAGRPFWLPSLAFLVLLY